MIINEMPGMALDSTTGQASQLQSGKTLYDGEGNLVTGTLSPAANTIKYGVTIAGVPGTLLSQTTTATASDLVSGKTGYNNSGNIITGSMASYGGEYGDAPKRVGGRIFYVNSSASGNTYVFYDSNWNVLSDQSVSGLANAYYYTKSGSGSTDKFYVYDNTSHTYSGVSITNGLSAKSLYWGYYGTSTGVTSNTIGSGKTNTQTILNRGVPTDYTPNIWGYIKDCRDNSLNGCNDWFIASKAEQDKLRNSGLVNWYSSDYIWSSVEYNSNNAYYWNYYYSNWDSYGKSNYYCAFAARAF